MKIKIMENCEELTYSLNLNSRKFQVGQIHESIIRNSNDIIRFQLL